MLCVDAKSCWLLWRDLEDARSFFGVFCVADCLHTGLQSTGLEQGPEVAEERDQPRVQGLGARLQGGQGGGGEGTTRRRGVDKRC